MIHWNDYLKVKPPERKFVLWNFEANPDKGYPACAVAGYLVYSAGEKDKPYVVCPGCHPFTLPRYWADCLGDNFTTPLWQQEINAVKRAINEH